VKGGLRGLLSRYKVPLIGAKILLSFALFAYVVAKVSPGDIWDTIRPADERYLLAAAGLFLLSNLIGSWIWARLLRAQGVPIPYRKAASYYFVGLFFNNFLPSNIGGDITRISDAAKHADHVSPVFSATVMDRLVGVLAMALVAVFASFAAIDRIHLYAIYMAIVITFVVSLGLFLSIFNRSVLKAFEWPFRVIGARTIERGIRRLMDDLHGYKHQGKVLRLVFAASLVVQVSRILVHYLVGLALGVRVAVGYYFLFVPALAALVSLPISLNGLGIREGAGVVLFHMAGMTKEQAFTVPFLTYLISVCISLLGGLIFVSRTPRRALKGILEKRRTARAAAAADGRARKGID
jgi:glycosyltransferase 2 family protein